jgi:purine-nucleoside phosphorylase
VIREAVAALRQQVPDWPTVGIILGSAQGSFAQALTGVTELPLAGIPGWPQPSVQGHAGKLIIGTAGATRCCVLSGRVHLYEGYTPQQVTFGIRVLALLGMKTLVVTNAAGGINPNYSRGLLVLLTDHLNLQGTNPLVGPNDETLGPRFPDMSAAYDPALRLAAQQAALELGIQLGAGVYAALLGPSFETPAEIRYLRTMGADLAGMSTVPEVIVARHMGVRVLGISTVTNMAAGMQGELSHQEVLETGRASAADLQRLLTALLPLIC